MPDESTPSADLLGIAVEHASKRVPRAAADETVGAVRSALVGQDFEFADEIVVLEGSRLVGLVSIERLLSARSDELVEALMDDDPPVVAPGDNQERVAWKMARHGESVIAVVDAAGEFAGLIPPDRMLSVLLEKHDRNLARIAGYLAGTRQAREAAEEDVRHRLWHRFPWLLIGLAGAMGAAVIMGAFERQLDENVLLAFFVPAVVYLADAVGTQTEAVLIRGLSAGVKIRDVLRREIASGLVIGLVLALAFFVFALGVWGDANVALSVALALIASCSIATVVAMLLPWAFQRMGTDPAFGSGPLATVIQDLLSIAVYLLIATTIVS